MRLRKRPHDGEGDASSPPTETALARARRDYWAHPFVLADDDRVDDADIYGMFNVKTHVRDLLAIVNDWAHFKGIVRLTRGILLDGPPGHGKTMATRWIVTAARARCYDVRDWPLADYAMVGGDVRALWNGARAEAARAGLPVILLWEEIAPALADAEVVGALKTEMDGLRGQAAPVFVIATANDLAGVDPALLRSGRFGLQGHCQPIPAAEQRRLLVDRLAAAGLPAPPAEYLRNLLTGGASAAALVEAVERVRMRVATSLRGQVVDERTIARLLVEQRFPIPDDREEHAVEEVVAWHETGHGLACFALGLESVLINVCDLGDVEGSVWFAEKKLPTYLDGFCSVVAAAAGKAMERFIFGDGEVTMYSASGDYLAIAEGFMHLVVVGGGPDGKRFDWHAMQEGMTGNAARRHAALDGQAADLAAAVGELAYALLAEVDRRLRARGTTLMEAIRPFVLRLVEERIILGADMDQFIAETLALPFGYFRTEALKSWAQFERRIREPGGAGRGEE